MQYNHTLILTLDASVLKLVPELFLINKLSNQIIYFINFKKMMLRE